MKKCFGCGEVKPLNEFYKHKKMADGHLNKCKSCIKSDVRRHRKDNDSVREYDRRRHAKNPKRRAATQATAKRWREKYPERYKAQTALNNAIRDGKIEKGPCEECGELEGVHAHHNDYSKPLEVRWFCPKHHHRHHAKERKKHGETKQTRRPSP